MKKEYKNPLLRVKKMQPQNILQGSGDDIKINYDDDITVDDSDDTEVL